MRPCPAACHQRQRGVEHVEIAPEMDRQQRLPVLFAALREIGLSGDPGDVDHRVEATVLVGQLSEQGVDGVPVGDRGRGCLGGPAGGHDATSRRVPRIGESLGAIERHQWVDGDHEPATSAQLLRNGPSDPTPAAGDDRDAPRVGHGTVERSSSSRPSRFPASSHCASSSR